MAQNMDVSTELSDDEEFDREEGGTYMDDIYIPPPIETATVFDPTAPRLMITKIDNDFFKSYGKGQSLGPFKKCFNAIVGPNGSGKSNVIDSLLFVFGYRASKIRCKKLSTLIHNSDMFKDVHSCSVAVHFVQIIDKEGDDYDVIPGSEFCISRTVSKDNTSNYYWDGKKVQFKQVAALLKKLKVDLEHNRFLILQGEVEQISMMKCKAEKDGETGMLEYLEDIIGTSRYIKPLEEVNQRVEVISEKMTERLNRLKIVENELNEMKAPMEEAVKFLKTENTIARSHNFLYQRAMKETKEKASVEIVKHEEVLEMQKKYIDELNELKNKKKEQNEEFEQEVHKLDKLKKQKDTLKKSFDTSENKDVQLLEEMRHLNKRRKEIKAQIESDKKKLIKLENLPEESEKSVKEIQQKLEKSTNEKEKHEEEKICMMKNIQRETKGLQQQKEELQKELAVLREDQEKKKADFNLAETELKMFISNEESEKQKLEALKTQKDAHENTIKEKGRQLQEIKKKIPSSRKELNEANVELLRVKQEEAQLVGEIRNKSSLLEEGKSSMQASKSKGKILDALMRAKTEGKCPGLFGRLGDLGAIDAKYDVAVSMACGALDNIVVDTVDCAQWCINFLKKYDLGRASFIALEKQEHLRRFTESRIQTPENVPRLFDLIRVSDDRVKTAFYYGLRDTLVADNLDQAQRVAYGAKRYRVVTLSGDTIEIVGTMSGGGKRVIRGKMGHNVQQTAQIDPRELRQVEEELREMETRVRELRQRQNYLEGRIQELQPMLRQWEIDENTFAKEMRNAQDLLPNLLRQLKEQEARAQATKTDQKQVKKLTAIVEEKREIFEEASETSGQLQVKVDKLTAEIKEKSTGKIKKIDKLIKDCTKNIDLCKTEITRLQVSLKTSKREYTTTTENISRLEKDLEQTENNMRQIKEDRDRMEIEGKEILEKIGELAEQIQEMEEALVELKKGLDKFTKEENRLKSEKVDVDEKLKVLDKKMKELNSTLQSFERKLSGLKLHEIDKEQPEELKKFTDEEIEEQDANLIEKELLAAENHIKAAKPNLNAINDYRRKETVYSEKALELHQISEKRAQMRTVYDDLRQRRKEEFTKGYNIIKMKLKEMYQMITLGGDAELELVDSYDPFTEGIQFNVRPPRKTWKKISNLSGGEKTLSSLALVFALHYYKPSPLYVMDEIDAALDFKNVSIVAYYIKERTKNAQFIVISLRYNMFELSDLMVGIYKTQNVSKSIAYDHRRITGARALTQNLHDTQREEMQVDFEKQTEEQSKDSEKVGLVRDSLSTVPME